MNLTGKLIVLIILAGALAGCASRMVVPQPSAITLESAMESVGTGLVKMREAEKGLRTGLIADEVQVTFNITATGTDASKLYVEITPIPTNPPTGGKGGAELTSNITAQRGNQITIKFKNILTASNKDTLMKDVNAVKELVEVITKTGLGGVIYYTTREQGEQVEGPFFAPKRK